MKCSVTPTNAPPTIAMGTPGLKGNRADSKMRKIFLQPSAKFSAAESLMISLGGEVVATAHVAETMFAPTFL